jgi:hypothetical protein
VSLLMVVVLLVLLLLLVVLLLLLLLLCCTLPCMRLLPCISRIRHLHFGKGFNESK